ncbi:MAG: hypothetical protein U1F68_08890 [Gammaproteobacteria bacterium]
MIPEAVNMVLIQLDICATWKKRCVAAALAQPRAELSRAGAGHIIDLNTPIMSRAFDAARCNPADGAKGWDGWPA